MAEAALSLSQVEPAVRHAVHAQLKASGITEEELVCLLYRQLASGERSVLDLLGPNATSRAAIQEVERGISTSFETVDDLFADLDADD